MKKKSHPSLISIKKTIKNSLDDKKDRSKKKDNDETDANKKDGQNENTTDVKNAVKLLPIADPLQKSTVKMIEEDDNKINAGDGVQKDNGKEESKEKTDCKNDIEDRKENISDKKKNVDTNKDAENKKEETEGKKGKTEQKNEPELNGKTADD
uniref:Cylicin_N domain-containing protein n=1 Tax=Heterorhabditis bacteriophora TaxID=37862 RepID=A0A1I7XM92_HETBA